VEFRKKNRSGDKKIKVSNKVQSFYSFCGLFDPCNRSEKVKRGTDPRFPGPPTAAPPSNLCRKAVRPQKIRRSLFPRSQNPHHAALGSCHCIALSYYPLLLYIHPKYFTIINHVPQQSAQSAHAHTPPAALTPAVRNLAHEFVDSGVGPGVVAAGSTQYAAVSHGQWRTSRWGT